MFEMKMLPWFPALSVPGVSPSSWNRMGALTAEQCAGVLMMPATIESSPQRQ